MHLLQFFLGLPYLALLNSISPVLWNYPYPQFDMASLLQPIWRFIRTETNIGITLLVVTALAMLLANSPWSADYFHFFEETHIRLELKWWNLDKPLYYWINDGLMAIFFLVIGLEVKREVLMGELSSFRKALLPVLAAVGGMLMPALIFSIFNWSDPVHIQGWAIPMATDIAFALGVMALLGKRVPPELKLFLASLAIVDDIGAVLTIAVFYTQTIYFSYLAIALGAWLFLFLLNRLGVNSLWVYLSIGLLLIWYPLLKSGVHATIAGILVAFAIPLRRKIDSKPFVQKMVELLRSFAAHTPAKNSRLLTHEQYEEIDQMHDTLRKVSSPLQRLENGLHDITLKWIMPIFAFANAGMVLGGIDWEDWATGGLTNGIFWGLLAGKLIGIVGFTWLGQKLGWIEIPRSITFRHLVGAGCLAGIGFTMSIFITELAFHGDTLITFSKVSILCASIVAGLAGFLVLKGAKEGG